MYRATRGLEPSMSRIGALSLVTLSSLLLFLAGLVSGWLLSARSGLRVGVLEPSSLQAAAKAPVLYPKLVRTVPIKPEAAPAN